MLHHILAPYCMAADLGLRLQHTILCQWLDAWSALVAAAAGGRAEPIRAAGGRDRRPWAGGRLGNGHLGGADRQGPDRRPASPPRETEESTRAVAIGAARGAAVAADRDDGATVLRRAYFKWLDEGRPDGQHLRHYFEAAREVRG